MFNRWCAELPFFLRHLPLWVLQGIRIIKLFAWERDFMSKIDKSRRNEMRSLRSYMVSESVCSRPWMSAVAMTIRKWSNGGAFTTVCAQLLAVE